MNQADKRPSLLRLRERISSEQSRAVWFFPEHEGVKGWDGTQDIFFVGLNPSGAGPGFPTNADKLLYNELRSNGFANAHLTNVIQVPSKRGQVNQLLEDRVLMGQCRTYLLEQVRMLQPRLIVAMDKLTEKILAEWLPNVVPTKYIRNYAWAVRFRREDEFRRDMGDVHREYGRTPPIYDR